MKPKNLRRCCEYELEAGSEQVPGSSEDAWGVCPSDGQQRALLAGADDGSVAAWQLPSLLLLLRLSLHLGAVSRLHASSLQDVDRTPLTTAGAAVLSWLTLAGLLGAYTTCFSMHLFALILHRGSTRAVSAHCDG